MVLHLVATVVEGTVALTPMVEVPAITDMEERTTNMAGAQTTVVEEHHLKAGALD